ncbi:hypothetical protein BDM02DRAFT_1452815 [Thelephora ganbajun]|uniref:Uncharacterized protein n=1 Tax=Thelephora ganbajun TaxID=370292 RepID=A0ACB6ZLM9_THEGA|nr:hypothetical protein BDM02DRAFT_1452815 [Thelephora ganbajun]
MGREINVDSILALDAEIIRLKRTRNSLLNVARIPPEILAYMFRFSITTTTESGDPDFARIKKGSYNFLLVCHHWYEVASSAPELWSSWGNSLEDWKRWHLRSGTSALDLVLDGLRHPAGSFDGDLRDALRDHVARGVIRKVHLRSRNIGLLTSIVSSLTPEGEAIRHSNIESIVLSDVDVCGFFVRHHFPKLRDLSLFGCLDLPLDHLKSHTSALVNLKLCDNTTPRTSIPTTTQILSLLASNPDIRTLMLRFPTLNNDSRHDFKHRVLLRHLEGLSLIGKIYHIFPILDRLEFPNTVDRARLVLSDCTLEQIRQDIGPYIRNYLQRDPRFRDRLCVSLFSRPEPISFDISAIDFEDLNPEQPPQRAPPHANFTMFPSQNAPLEARKQLRLDILALLPQESIISLETDHTEIEEMVVTMPNLEFLYLFGVVVSNRFLLPKPDGPNAHRKLLPSLQRLYLEDVTAMDDNWDPLICYLSHQTRDNLLVSLSIFGEGVHICPEVVEQIERFVEEFIYLPEPDSGCSGLRYLMIVVLVRNVYGMSGI